MKRWFAGPVLLLGLAFGMVAGGVCTAAGACIEYPGYLSWVGEYTFSSARSVCIAGDLALVGTPTGLVVFDISDPARPAPISQLPMAYPSGIAVSGGRAFLSGWDLGFKVVDLTDPAHPIPLAGLPLNGAGRLAVQGDLAYVTGVFGIRVIDVSDPAIPVEIGSWSGTPAFDGIAISGNLAVLTTNQATTMYGIGTFDLSNPIAPVLLSTLAFPTRTYDASLAGGLAYVANSYDGVQIVDVSDPVHPSVVGRGDTVHEASGVAVVGALALVVDAGMRIFDVSNPSQPVETGYFRSDGYVRQLAAAGSLAIIAGYDNGITLADINPPISAPVLGQTATPGSCTGVARTGDTNFVLADLEKGLTTGTLEDPAAPGLYVNHRTAGQANRVAVRDSLAFLAAGTSGLHVYNVSDASNPTHVSWIETPGDARDVGLAGQYALVADGTSVLVVNTADPVHLGVAATLPIPARDLSISSSLAAVCGATEEVAVVDLSDPASPDLLCMFPTHDVAWAVALDGRTLLVAGTDPGNPTWGGLELVDLTEPSAPVSLAYIPVSSPATAVACANGFAYVGTGVRTLVVDVTVPAAARVIGSFDESLTNGGEIVADPEFLMIASGWHRLTMAYPGCPQTTGADGMDGGDGLPAVRAAAWPNPAAERTTLRFRLPRAQHALVEIFDTSGRRIRTLVDEPLPSGTYTRTWEGNDDRGHRVPAGMYFVRVPGERDARRVVILQGGER